jgi:hypothetical protein
MLTRMRHRLRCRFPPQRILTARPRSSISNATNLEEIGEFWDTHDFTEHDYEPFSRRRVGIDVVAPLAGAEAGASQSDGCQNS